MDQNKVNLWLHYIIVLKLLLSGYSNVYTELSRRFVGKEGDFQPHCFQLWCITFLREGGWLSTVMHHLPVRGRGKTPLGNCRKQSSYDVNSLFGARISTVEKCLKQVQTEQGVNYIEEDNWFHRHLSQEEICFLKINILNQKP